MMKGRQRMMKSHSTKITKHEGTKDLEQLLHNETQSSRQQASKFKDQDHKERSQ